MKSITDYINHVILAILNEQKNITIILQISHYKKRSFYENNKENFDKYNKKRKSRISDLDYQFNTLTHAMESFKSTISAP